jgi:hypothetical protein
MSKLIQIESAVAELPARDQWTLLSWLQEHLGSAQKPQTTSAQERQRWLTELAELRGKTGTDNQGVPLQQLMDELREERF